MFVVCCLLFVVELPFERVENLQPLQPHKPPKPLKPLPTSSPTSSPQLNDERQQIYLL